MKIHSNESLIQNLTREIQQTELYIQEYRNARGCLYYILLFDNYTLSELHKRLKKLHEELADLTDF